MQCSSQIISKQRRRELFISWLPRLLPPCRRCIPHLVQCSCKHDCDCEINILLLNPETGKECSCNWEDHAYIALLASALARLDPENYGQPPPPPASISLTTISSAGRVLALRRRNSCGFGLRHPDDRADSGREGELIEMQGNGVKKRKGVGKVEESKHEARWAESFEKRAHKVHGI